MTKKEVQQRVLQNGKPLLLDKFEWDEVNKVFSSEENDLVLDFKDVDGCTFKTGSYCTFDTGNSCMFDTSNSCTFKAGSDCTFKTGSYCTFEAGSECTFDTGYNCTFDTGSYCTFDTGNNCVVVRRDIYEVIEISEDTKIKLNECGIKGYTVKDVDKNKILEKIIKHEAKIEKLKAKLKVT